MRCFIFGCIDILYDCVANGDTPCAWLPLTVNRLRVLHNFASPNDDFLVLLLHLIHITSDKPRWTFYFRIEQFSSTIIRNVVQIKLLLTSFIHSILYFSSVDSRLNYSDFRRESTIVVSIISFVFCWFSPWTTSCLFEKGIFEGT